MLPFSTSFVFSMAPQTSDLTLTGHGFIFLFTPHVGISDATSAQHLGFLNFSNNGDSNNHVFGAEFDVFRNEELNDIDDNHVGINVNSLSSMSAYEAGFWCDDNRIKVEFKKLKLNNGKNYQVWIDYSDNSLNVTMALAGSKRPKTPLLNYTFNLSLSFIKKVEDEVSRLEKFKSGKMREIVLKKRLELEDICRRTHMVTEELSAMKHSAEAIESGLVDPMYLLEQIESKFVKVKKEAGSRKDILDKVEKWMDACEKESWLEEYNRDENRYNAGRGAHLMLRLAEKARVALSKTPALVETLISRVTIWEKERETEFVYDGVK